MKIIFVDDDELMHKLVAAFFKKANLELISCYNGKEALKILAKDKGVKLVITDYHMSIMNGLDLAREIKKNKLIKEIPLILITAYPEIAEQIHHENLFDEILAKPVNFHSLIVKSKYYLDNKASQTSVLS